MFSSCPHISFNTICKQSTLKLYIEQHLTARMQHFHTWRVTLFPLASYRSCFSPFLVIPFYASGCTWSRCTATRAHTPRPGWSSSQNVLRSVPSSPVGFPYYAVCRWELQWRHSTLQTLDTAQWSRKVLPWTLWTVDPGKPERRRTRRPPRGPSGPALPGATRFLWRMRTATSLWSCQTYSCTIGLSSACLPTPTTTSPSWQ